MEELDKYKKEYPFLEEIIRAIQVPVVGIEIGKITEDLLNTQCHASESSGGEHNFFESYAVQDSHIYELGTGISPEGEAEEKVPSPTIKETLVKSGIKPEYLVQISYLTRETKEERLRDCTINILEPIKYFRNLYQGYVNVWDREPAEHLFLLIEAEDERKAREACEDYKPKFKSDLHVYSATSTSSRPLEGMTESAVRQLRKNLENDPMAQIAVLKAKKKDPTKT
jgi:hypothetical protein